MMGNDILRFQAAENRTEVEGIKYGLKTPRSIRAVNPYKTMIRGSPGRYDRRGGGYNLHPFVDIKK